MQVYILSLENLSFDPAKDSIVTLYNSVTCIFTGVALFATWKITFENWSLADLMRKQKFSKPEDQNEESYCYRQENKN